MEKIFETKADAQTKLKRETARLPIYKFIKDNFDLWDELFFLEDNIHEFACEIEEKSSLLGEIDKNKKLQKIEAFKKEELTVLDKLIKKLNKSKEIRNIPSNKELFDAYRLVCEINECGEINENEESLDHAPDAVREDHILDISQLLQKRLAEKKATKQKHISLKSKEEIAAILVNDNARLTNVRKILSASPTKNSDPNIFDPQGELLEISKRASDDIREETTQPPIGSKKERLKKYKNELGSQLLGMSKINSFLEYGFSQMEDTDRESLYHEFKSKAKEYKLADWQIERYNEVFDTFAKATQENIDFIEKNKNLSGREIIKNITGYTCAGEVEIEKHPFVTIFIISDDHDFSGIQSPKPSKKEPRTEDAEKINDCRGFCRMGFIFIRKTETADPQAKQALVAHEVKHRINELVRNGAYDKEYSLDSYPKNIKEYFAGEIAFALSMAKDEILAYFKDGEDTEDILARLVHTEYYNYLDESDYKGQETRESLYGADILKKYNAQVIGNEFIKCKDKYIKIISNCLEILETLERWGFSRGEIVGMFQVQKMTNWGKIFNRFGHNPEFIEERNINSDKKIESLGRDLQQYRNKNSWLKRKLNKLKIKLPFGLSDHIHYESFKESMLEAQLQLLQKEKLRWSQEAYAKVKE